MVFLTYKVFNLEEGMYLANCRITHLETNVYKKHKHKFVHFSLDDTINIFKDLTNV